ncbi:TIGR01244 family sulfur transferase [Anianabacter salinae]|uniref:TIGR01244 family sulfur transferase n=1 Tax=Anianabacter salinae TaxID=2851023 RepID=UPI00225E640B|nr:TIGR01244 family sulfur transferase [Anianabacter salinae]MBV0912304.1 TIGR01244 family phosphatase [Anianabacter salinae]
MDLRQITHDYAVAPQIDASDMQALADAGYVLVIDNRPDNEVEPELQSDRMREAAEAAGLQFIYNPVINGGLTLDMVRGQGEAIGQAEGKVFAYCRSGTRSTIVWALSLAGQAPADDLIGKAAAAGYDLSGMKGQIEALSRD